MDYHIISVESPSTVISARFSGALDVKKEGIGHVF